MILIYEENVDKKRPSKVNNSRHIMANLQFISNATFGYNRGVNVSMISLPTYSLPNTDLQTWINYLSSGGKHSQYRT